MKITAEMIRERIKDLSVQRDNALATFHQTVGAISLAEHFLSKIENEGDEASMTLDELASSFGSDEAEIIQLKKSNS